MGCLRSLLPLVRVVAVGIVVAAGAPAAHAAIESDLVKQGVAAYNDLEYPRAIALLQKALATETLTREEKLVTFQTLAFAHVALDKTDEAIKDFEALLRVDGAFALDRTISPRVRAVFEQARARVSTGQGVAPGGAALPTVTPTVTPAHVKEGQAVDLRLSYPGGVARKVELFYRTRGQYLFSKLTAPVDASGEVAATVPGLDVHAPALEYYLVVLDDSGASVAQGGTLPEPLVVDVAARKQPVYTKAWFWGVLGGVAVVGAGVATAVVLTTRSTITSSTPATISIQPH